MITTQEKKLKKLAKNAIKSFKNLKDWKFSFKNLRNKKHLGVCEFELKKIIINRSMYFNVYTFIQILIHEIAHAITNQSSHNKIWIKNAKDLGYENDTYIAFCKKTKYFYQGICLDAI